VNNNHLHTAKEILKDFTPLSLAEMDQVKLMDRVDSKFVIAFSQLAPLLNSIAEQYRVLTINNTRVFSYRTDYFDTPDFDMFSDHHNGKLNRFKIRQREYVESNIRFLEIKFKSNKGRVIKDRIERTQEDQQDFSTFVHKYTPYNPQDLTITVINRFNRFTLVDQEMKERVTVDFNLSFSDTIQEVGLNGLVIIEVKQNKSSRNSHIYNALKEGHVRPESFSKYCLGVSMLNRHNKFNNFKKTISLVNKLSHVEISA
jgi:hypothetical protein